MVNTRSVPDSIAVAEEIRRLSPRIADRLTEPVQQRTERIERISRLLDRIDDGTITGAAARTLDSITRELTAAGVQPVTGPDHPLPPNLVRLLFPDTDHPARTYYDNQDLVGR